MTDNSIIQKAIEEIEEQTFGVTKQLLEIHKVIYINNKPKVSRLDKDNADGTAIVYFPIIGEKFYLAIYVDTNPKLSIRTVHTEPYHSVSFRATSEELNFKSLSTLTKLKSTDGWDKADKKRFGNSFYTFASLTFEPNPEADEFEDKIEKLINFLESDREGVRKLVDTANGHIQIISSFHNGNTMLGGYHLSKVIIRRIANLNIGVDFDVYADGNFFKE